jgi:hypothetical protein
MGITITIYVLMTVVERKSYVRNEGWTSSPSDSVKVFNSYESALEDMKNWRQHLKSSDEVEAVLYLEDEFNSERPMSHYVSLMLDDEYADDGDVVQVDIRQKIHIFEGKNFSN